MRVSRYVPAGTNIVSFVSARPALHSPTLVPLGTLSFAAEIASRSVHSPSSATTSTSLVTVIVSGGNGIGVGVAVEVGVGVIVPVGGAVRGVLVAVAGKVGAGV